MYNRIYKFFSENNISYPLQFGFKQQYSIFHGLISLTEDIMKNVDKETLVVIFLLTCKRLLILLNMTSCQLSLSITVFIAWQIIGLNPISSENNLFK